MYRQGQALHVPLRHPARPAILAVVGTVVRVARRGLSLAQLVRVRVRDGPGGEVERVGGQADLCEGDLGANAREHAVHGGGRFVALHGEKEERQDSDSRVRCEFWTILASNGRVPEPECQCGGGFRTAPEHRVGTGQGFTLVETKLLKMWGAEGM